MAAGVGVDRGDASRGGHSQHVDRREHRTAWAALLGGRSAADDDDGLTGNPRGPAIRGPRFAGRRTASRADQDRQQERRRHPRSHRVHHTSGTSRGRCDHTRRGIYVVSMVLEAISRCFRVERVRLSVVALAAFVLLPASAGAADWGSRPIQVDGLTVPARASAEGVELSRGGGLFVPRFWAGVNLGVTIPGHDPGELAIPRSDYDRWLAEMGELGVRVLRVYTLQRPVFYDALASYDRRHPRAPLWLLQGIYLDQARLDSVENAYDPILTAESDRDIRDVVAAVHGDASIPRRPGLAYGHYRASVSRWLLGWSFGVEWDPTMALLTDQENAGVPRFHGTYFTATSDATPLESWIATRLDLLATEEAHRGWSRPVTFTNWVTTDPLSHPAEPLATEDEVSVDPLHVQATDRWPGGSFASY
ncbi:MAG: hypothetical protein JOY78_08330, partial [Pseudonocardia sp.]|nr:hypothetical protein [Pseudonocardia sp.]